MENSCSNKLKRALLQDLMLKLDEIHLIIIRKTNLTRMDRITERDIKGLSDQVGSDGSYNGPSNK